MIQALAQSPKGRDSVANYHFTTRGVPLVFLARRDSNAAPDTDFNGYNFWVNKLNAFNGNYITGEMVKAFLNSRNTGDVSGRECGAESFGRLVAETNRKSPWSDLRRCERAANSLDFDRDSSGHAERHAGGVRTEQLDSKSIFA